MKTLIAVAASVLVNASLIAVFERNALESIPVPAGEVIVTDLSADAGLTLAQAALPTADEVRAL